MLHVRCRVYGLKSYPTDQLYRAYAWKFVNTHTHADIHTL